MPRKITSTTRTTSRTTTSRKARHLQAVLVDALTHQPTTAATPTATPLPPLLQWPALPHDHQPPSATTRTGSTAQPQPPAPPAPPVENGPRLGEWMRGPATRLQVNYSLFNGHHFVALRVWQLLGDGRWVPDPRRGVSVKLAELPGVIAALHHAQQLADLVDMDMDQPPIVVS